MILQLKIIQSLIISAFLLMHPVHVSVTNMEYFPDKQEIEFSTKIFMDDFQLLFIHLKELNIDFENQDTVKKYKSDINQYIDSHFKLKINNIDKAFTFNGFKNNNDAIWLYYNLKINEEIKSIKIINTILLDLYFDQKNLFIFKAGDIEKAYQFNIKNREYNIDINVK